jgi:hypothetical protein
MDYEYNDGYKIVRKLGFDNGGGVAFGVNKKKAFPFATWQFAENNKKKYFCGYYFALENFNAAKLDFDERVKKYKTENPGITEKYNYLASVEMDEEGNYNMIDGIINNVPKPSLLERIKEYERLIAKNTNNDTDVDNPEICRPAQEEL